MPEAGGFLPGRRHSGRIRQADFESLQAWSPVPAGSQLNRARLGGTHQDSGFPHGLSALCERYSGQPLWQNFPLHSEYAEHQKTRSLNQWKFAAVEPQTKCAGGQVIGMCSLNLHAPSTLADANTRPAGDTTSTTSGKPPALGPASASISSRGAASGGL